ncbi:MAG: DUF559 domain-containing protein [Clostridia bacterium]|nr:DUF559 domain-containing protein [Clostridia bacterium]
MYPYNKKLVANSQALRKNMTHEEKHLWYDFLKMLPMPVKRQKNIENYIVDFYIPQVKTVIEIDGIQHTADDHYEKDQNRDLNLKKWGIKVLRYSNKEINSNFNSVVLDILNNIGLTEADLNL